MSAAADRIQDLLKPTGEEDLLPVRYPSPRVRVEPKQAVAAAAVALALVGGWAVTRTSSSEAQPAAWDGTAVETTTAAAAKVVVSVVGEVESPGLVTLEGGARVADALHAARPRPEADVYALNQAQLLVDGQQILVPAQGAAPAGAGAPGAGAAGGAGGAPGAAGGGVSINSAGTAELTTLPGVGAATAAAIIAHREANGPFTSIDGLLDVKGIGPAKLEALRGAVVL